MKQNRRSFLQGAAVAAVAGSASRILGANDRVNVAVVGLGGRGRAHVTEWAKVPGSRIVALCDVDQAALERGQALAEKTTGEKTKGYVEMRKLFEDKDIDAVSMPLPNHWHALATIWACQAGKDVYIEKPACHNVWEGKKMVEAARKYNRMVQIGSQSRTVPIVIRAMQLLKEGVIGKVYLAKGLCYKRRPSIGHKPDGPVPPGVNWDLFLGPAPMRPFNENRFKYNWHWFWDTGNGDIGNQGVHEMDIALWGLGRTDWPKSVSSTGGKFIWKDDQETPNTQQASLLWDDGELSFDVRNLPTPPEALAPMRGPNYVGNIFFGDLGFMTLDGGGFQVYKSAAGNFVGARGAGAGSKERYEKVAEEKPVSGSDTVPHVQNFIAAVKSRDHTKLAAEIEIGARSAAFCHLANIAYRTGRLLKLDSGGRFIGDDEANAMQTRDYRAPYIVPDQV